MNMNEVFINESSLEGQYEDVEEFLEKYRISEVCELVSKTF